MKESNENEYSLHFSKLYPVWECPDCGFKNRYVDSFFEVCSGCKKDHTLDWGKFVVLNNGEKIKITFDKFEIGYLRRDDDGHWFLIPEEEVENFDKVLNQELPDMFIRAGEEFDDLYETEMLKFSKYRLSGGVCGLKVLME